MRLARVERGHRLPAKFKLFAIGMVSRKPAPDVLRTLMYRPEFFGTPASALFQAALREESEWTVYEREAMASFVSGLNQCVF